MTTNTTELSLNATMKHSDCMVLQAQDFIPWDNPDNIISAQTRKFIRHMIILVIFPITFLIGVPANIINMVVFYKQGLKERINVCLFALSLSDGLYLAIFTVPNAESLYLHITSKEINGPVLTWFVNHNLMGFYSFTWVSQVLTAIVASERCFCVLQPLKSQIILRTSTMTAVIAVVFVVVVGLRFIVVTRYYIVCAYDPLTGSITMMGGVQDFYKSHKKIVDFLDVFMYGVGIPWVVILVVVTTTVITVIKLHQAAVWRADMSSGSDSASARDIGVTRMLVGNSIFFIICVFPFGLFRLALLFVPEMNLGRRYHNLYGVGILLFAVTSYINATFNIVVYYAMGSRYRQTFWTLLGRKTTKHTPIKTSAIVKAVSVVT